MSPWPAVRARFARFMMRPRPSPGWKTWLARPHLGSGHSASSATEEPHLGSGHSASSATEELVHDAMDTVTGGGRLTVAGRNTRRSCEELQPTMNATSPPDPEILAFSDDC
jgi:hypothetical protein